jgi:hypothetical protein
MNGFPACGDPLKEQRYSRSQRIEIPDGRKNSGLTMRPDPAFAAGGCID